MGRESVLESVRRYFLCCPLLGEGVVGLDRVDEMAVGYAVRGAPQDDRVLRRYLDGGRLRRVGFDLCSRERAGADTRHFLRARRFYDALEEWISRQDRLPELSGGRRAVSMEAVGQAQVTVSTQGSALWALRCHLDYLQPPPGLHQPSLGRPGGEENEGGEEREII